MEMLIQMPWAIVTEQLASAKNARTTRLDHIASNVCQDISAIHLHCRMEIVNAALAFHLEQTKRKMAYRLAISWLEAVGAKPTSSVEIVTNVKMDFSTSTLAMAAKVATAILWEVSIHLVIHSVGNATANQALLGEFTIEIFHFNEIFISLIFYSDFVAINALLISTDSRRKAANHVIVMNSVQKDSSAINMDNVRATTTSKVVAAIDAKRTNSIVTKDAWIVQTVTI